MKDSFFVSDVVDIEKFRKDSFNLIASGCGTGKSHFIANDLLNHYKGEVRPCEVLFVTSRALTVAQQSNWEDIVKYDPESETPVKYWNGQISDDEIDLSKFGINIMTYDKIVEILNDKNHPEYKTLNKVKIIVFDECHILYSDLFIKDINMIKLWIRYLVYSEDMLLLGLTATPNILKFNQQRWGVKINQVNKNTLIRYRARQLICTDFKSITQMFYRKKLKGKTIIMCCSVSDCFELQKKLPNAAVLISESNKRYSEEMIPIRNKIVMKETLPETFLYPTKRDSSGKPIEFEERRLDILLTTSTLREGVSLREHSGIKNVICCSADELHVVQFAGRCRFNIDNLIVANRFVRSDYYDKDSYLSLSRASFREFMKDKNCTDWFDGISHIVEHDKSDIKWFVAGRDEDLFIEYINKKWLVPEGEENTDKYRIYKKEDKQKIVQQAIDCKLFNIEKRRITYAKVMKFMEEQLGYEIGSQRTMIGGKRYTCKTVLFRKK